MFSPSSNLIWDFEAIQDVARYGCLSIERRCSVRIEHFYDSERSSIPDCEAKHIVLLENGCSGFWFVENYERPKLGYQRLVAYQTQCGMPGPSERYAPVAVYHSSPKVTIHLESQGVSEARFFIVYSGNAKIGNYFSGTYLDTVIPGRGEVISEPFRMLPHDLVIRPEECPEFLYVGEIYGCQRQLHAIPVFSYVSIRHQHTCPISGVRSDGGKCVIVYCARSAIDGVASHGRATTANDHPDSSASDPKRSPYGFRGLSQKIAPRRFCFLIPRQKSNSTYPRRNSSHPGASRNRTGCNSVKRSDCLDILSVHMAPHNIGPLVSRQSGAGVQYV